MLCNIWDQWTDAEKWSEPVGMWIEMSMPYDPVCACYPMHGVSSTGYVHCRPVFGSKVIFHPELGKVPQVP